MLNKMNSSVKTSFAFLLILLLLTTSCSKPQSQVCFDRICVNVEIADTPSEQAQGLMYRTSLDGGMIFKFDNPSRNFFWMKNTLIPLDMIWLDEQLDILYIEKNVPPCKIEDCPHYGPEADSMYVIEVNSGFMDANGLSSESEVEFRNI